MSDRIVMRTGECLIAGGPPFTAAEPEVVIGELDGPVGTALATLTGDQTKGHSKVFAILNTDIQVRPVTLCVSKVTVNNSRYTNILMGTVQAAIANGVLDAVRAGDLPKDRVNDLGIICSVWLNPGVIDTNMLRCAFGEEASGYRNATEWAKTAAPFLLKLSASENGRALTAP